MNDGGCPKCHCLWFKLKTIWYPEPKFSRTPSGSVDIYYKCANCGWGWHEHKELQDMIVTTDK